MPPSARLTSPRRLLRRAFSAVRSLSGAYDPPASSVYSFGDGSSGALGLASSFSADAYEPTRVPSLPPRISAVAAGHYHSLALSADGHLFSWGRNHEAQLGRALNSPRDTWSTPEMVLGLDHVRICAAAASGVVSAAIGDDGSLWVWGRSKRGQLGLGEGVIEAFRPSRVEALSGHEICKVSFGWGHALALAKDGKLFGWGYSEDGRLGQMGHALQSSSTPSQYSSGSMEKPSSILDIAEGLVAEKIEREENMPIIWEPTIVQERSHLKVSDVACGLDHSLVLCCDGTLLSCGNNTYGQLGRVAEEPDMQSVITKDFQPLSLSAGLGHSLAVCRLTSETTAEEETGVLSWGWNCSSQLGRWGIEDIPALVEGLEGERPVSVSAGRVHSIVLTSKGEVWAWGSGRNGRLGLGSSEDETEPTLVEQLDGMMVLQVVTGFDHNLLLVAE